ncbi:MAG: FHA domain-containing protein [Gemmatimonadaceae bacterium]
MIVVFILLLVAAIVYMEAGDLLKERFLPHRALREMPLPFLIMPLSSSDGPVGAPATRWAPMPESWSRPAVAEDDPEFDEDDGEHPGGATVVFRRPPDEATQLLPGRLKVIAGENGREDIRLVGVIGEQRPQIVLGREQGPPQKVITLHSPTVSRRHAQMELVDGRWRIVNLSRTNPVMVNDEILSAGRGAVKMLSDGDRIELGEVVLRFSTR